jgi:hypothetical protein
LVALFLIVYDPFKWMQICAGAFHCLFISVYYGLSQRPLFFENVCEYLILNLIGIYIISLVLS